MPEDRIHRLQMVRAAVHLACRDSGARSPLERATIGVYALLRARAGTRDVEKLAAEALAAATAAPDKIANLTLGQG